MNKWTREFEVLERKIRHGADNAERHAAEHPGTAALALEFARAARIASAAADRLAYALQTGIAHKSL